MRKMKCVHPRKAFNLMQQFINNANDLYYNYSIDVRLKKGDCFCADGIDSLDEAEDDTLTINYNFDELWDISAKIFRAYWTKKSPILKGFSDITITLLHELGHLETTEKVRPNFSINYREEVIEELTNKYRDYTILNHYYFALPDEKSATEWAIEWLSNAENRKIAKAFEKKFFACFAEI